MTVVETDRPFSAELTGQAHKMKQSNPEMALMQAVKAGHVKDIKQLITSGGLLTLNSRDTGTTPLIEACKFNDKEVAKRMIKMLLKHGANVNHRDREGRNALHWVSINGDKQLINLLIDSQTSIDYQTTDNQGNSILFYAVETGNCGFVRHICRIYKLKSVKEKGKNKRGISAADLALKLGHKKCAEMCKEVMLGDSRELGPPVHNYTKANYFNDLNEQTVLPPIASQRAEEAYKPGQVVPKISRKARDGNNPNIAVGNFHPHIRSESQHSDEIIGQIDYKFVLTDLNWIQAVESTGSYRQGVDERARLERLQNAAQNGFVHFNHGSHPSRKNPPHKVKRVRTDKTNWQKSDSSPAKAKKGKERRVP